MGPIGIQEGNMCLGIPLKIVVIEGKEALGEMNGVKKKIRVDLLPQVKVGDYVMVHAGFALEIMDDDTAKDTLEAILELDEAMRAIGS
jgi:hydrogenase expression/formation protein HypC